MRGLIETKLNGLQSVLENSEIAEDCKPRRLKAKIRWGQRHKEEAEATQKAFKEIDAKIAKILRSRWNTGKGPRSTDRKKLKTIIRKFDKTLCESLGRKARHNEVVMELQNNYQKYDKSHHIKHLDLDEDSFEYGDGFFMRWGQQFSKLISESRKDTEQISESRKDMD